MPASTAAIPTPGARVLIRDAEWVVRRVDHAPGGYQLVCDGASELVRGHEAVFLTALDPVTALNPAATRLVPDESPRFADGLLYLESHLRQAVPGDDAIHLGHTAAMDLVPYQLEPARQALARPRQRILIADAVGLGKTLEAGILVSELIARGRGRRILVLAVKSMLTQFQKEFWNRFTIPLTRLDSIGIQRVRSRIPANHNPFYYYDKAIISIDTLKQDAEYRTYLEQARWDIIVIDEAHNVADRGTRSLRSRLAKLLSRQSDTLIMLSATPHDGRARSFASLVNMLDATAIADPDDYTAEDFRPGLVIRRFKKDVQDQVRDAFRDREVATRRCTASNVEEAAFEALLSVRAANAHRQPTNRNLFLVTLEKALFSSPAACMETARERIGRSKRNLEQGSGASGLQAEVAGLESLTAALERITPERYAKYQALLDVIRNDFGWRGDDPADRIVVFTERIPTLNWLKPHLARDLGLTDLGRIAVLHGGLSDTEQQRLVEDFGNSQRAVRLLLCSDIASEGINLHHQCHRLIHFDLPWSLMVFAQRNGRIDRYGQARTPRIVYLVTDSSNATIRGDTRILEVLRKKDEQAYQNIGDPSVFMGVHDVEEEEAVTQNAIADRESAEAFDERLTPAPSEGDKLLALFLGDDAAADPPAPVPAMPPAPLSLFKDELDYCATALDRLRQTREADASTDDLLLTSAARVRFTVNRETQTLTLDAPDDLAARFSYLPPEVLPASRRFVLTTDRARVQAAIAESRRSESTWPSAHYLWRLNPVVEWLNDRVLAAFGRFEAPVLSGIPGLQRRETVFVCSGLVPNRKSHPLLYEWAAVVYRDGEFVQLVPFATVVERTGIGEDAMANRGQPVDVAELSALLPDAVERARAHFRERRDQFEGAINIKLEEEVAALDAFRTRSLKRLEPDPDQPRLTGWSAQRNEQERLEIDAIHDEYLQWIEDTMTSERAPWVQVLCALTAVEPLSGVA